MALFDRLCAAILLGVLTLVCCQSDDRYWSTVITDIDGNPLLEKNISGCHFHIEGYTLQCPDHHHIAPVSYEFFLRHPEKPVAHECRCTPEQRDTCDINCCSYDATTDCRLVTHPTKDLRYNIDTCSWTSTCPSQNIGWIGVWPGDSEDCPEWGIGQGHPFIYSLAGQLNYYCIKDEWSVFITRSENKTGRALYLQSPDNFGLNNGFYNLSCVLTAESGTIDIRALDFRLCKDLQEADNDQLDNTQSCGQFFRVYEGDRLKRTFDVTPNSQNGWMSLKQLYQSETNTVTLKLDSEASGHTFALWFYVKPSQGNIIIQCQTAQAYIHSVLVGR